MTSVEIARGRRSHGMQTRRATALQSAKRRGEGKLRQWRKAKARDADEVRGSACDCASVRRGSVGRAAAAAGGHEGLSEAVQEDVHQRSLHVLHCKHLAVRVLAVDAASALRIARQAFDAVGSALGCVLAALRACGFLLALLAGWVRAAALAVAAVRSGALAALDASLDFAPCLRRQVPALLQPICAVDKERRFTEKSKRTVQSKTGISQLD